MRRERRASLLVIVMSLIISMTFSSGCIKKDATEKVSTVQFSTGQVEIINTQDIIEVILTGDNNVITITMCKKITLMSIGGNNNVISMTCNVTTEELIVEGDNNVLSFSKEPSNIDNKGVNNVISTSGSGGFGGDQDDLATSDEVLYEYSHQSIGLNQHGNERFEVEKIFKAIRFEIYVKELTLISMFEYSLVDANGNEQYSISLQGRDEISENKDLPFSKGTWDNVFDITSFDGEATITITGLAY